MSARHDATPAGAVRPPRALAWIVLLASAAAVLGIGLLATIVLFSRTGSWPTPPPSFWPRLLAACLLTLASLALRSVRWVFLLRRSGTRIPIRDAFIGDFAGLSLLFAPLLLGEIAIRAWVLRARGGVPMLTTTVVNVWERVLDVVTLIALVCVAELAGRRPDVWIAPALGASALMLVPAVRRHVLRAIIAVGEWGTRAFDPQPSTSLDVARLAATRSWLPAVGASLLIWSLPGAGLWLLSSGWGSSFDLPAAEEAYARSAMLGAAWLAPGGVLVAGPDMLAALAAHGLEEHLTLLTVFGTRLATVGLSIALGLVFVLIHLRTTHAERAAHFDDIADAYDVQIPESRRVALLERKTTLMNEVLHARKAGRKGLDVGCGQGAYIGRMRELGFDVAGIDASAGQIRLAAAKLGALDIARVGSTLDIPAANDSYDFIYVVNVLHHLDSVEAQRRAFAELLRVLKPEGLLFVHEINTRNVLFRFYMGYVFPSLNCIDEGVERWLLPHRLAQYTEAPVVDVRYFTFLPEFVPRVVAHALKPFERLLESSRLRVYSAHYMAVFQKASVSN